MKGQRIIKHDVVFVGESLLEPTWKFIVSEPGGGRSAGIEVVRATAEGIDESRQWRTAGDTQRAHRAAMAWAYEEAVRLAVLGGLRGTVEVHRRPTHHVEGQEEACAALWDFARDVLELSAEARGSFAERPRQHVVNTGAGHDPMTVGISTIPVTDEQLAVVRKALERIVRGFGFQVTEIQ